MQKVKLQNKWDNETKSFDKSAFELKETDKTISGKISISAKENDKWISKPISFIAFKSKIDAETENAIKFSNGQSFEVELNLSVGSFKDNNGKETVYHKAIINKARQIAANGHQQDKQNGYQRDNVGLAPQKGGYEEEADDQFIPF